MIIQNPAFVQAIAARGLLTPEDTQDVLGPARDASRLLRWVINHHLLAREEAGRLWADGFGVAFIDLDKTLFQASVVQLLDQTLAERHRMILVYEMGGAVTAAMANPADRDAIALVSKLIGRPVSPVCALPEQIDHAIDVEYHSFSEFSALKKQATLAVSLVTSNRPLGREELERVAGQEVVVKLVDTLLLLAVKEDASDIHLEPREEAVQVRFRIDGTLHERSRLSHDLYPRILSRVKIMAGMDITERRHPQDGRITFEVGGRGIEVRVSTVPSLYGETLALRVLGQLRMRDVPVLEELEFSHSIMERVRQVIGSPNGVFFVTGPTGCGKTTTIFSVLREINRTGINIMTVEEPVEYRLPGITQVPVDRATGVGFADILRSFLRQDPDVLLIGEIRDLETARIATEAALTGHLVLATLHTNDAIQATTRLIEIGVEPFLVGPTIIGVLAQRLVRKICEACKEAYDPGDEVLDRLFERTPDLRVPFYRGRGCPACGNSGYRGRLAIHEMLIVDDEIRRLISNGKPPLREVYMAAAASGYQAMRHDGMKKVLRGLTTLEELDLAAPDRW